MKLKKTTAKERAAKYADGGEVNWGQLGGQISSMLPVLQGLMGALENNPQAYSKQPTLNASTMRGMVTPYAFGGMEGGMDEDQMTQLQQMADEQGITVEELIEQLQSQAYGTDESSNDSQDIPDEEPEESEEVPEEDQEDGFFKYGGRIGKGGNKINVEGKEMVKAPGQNLLKVHGPSHSDGGVNLEVPSGTKIYSDRIGIDGKTMAERKLTRERRLAKLNKLIDKNPSDVILKNSLKRTTEVTSSEENKDMAIQKIANHVYNSPRFATGGTVDPNDPWKAYMDNKFGTAPTPYQMPGLLGGVDKVTPYATGSAAIAPNLFNGAAPVDNQINPIIATANKDAVAASAPKPVPAGTLTPGDYVGMAGTAFGTIAPLLATLGNRRNTKPNVNRFKSFGHDALDANQAAMDVALGTKASAETELNTSAGSSYMRNSNSASSINTLRALDAVTDLGKNKAKASIGDAFAAKMIGLLGQKSQLSNVRDNVVAHGQTATDIENKADTDNFYSNLATNLSGIGTGAQEIGRNLNISHGNKVDANLLSQLSQYNLTFDANGNLITNK